MRRVLPLALFFVLAGANHFRVPALYESIIPPLLPHPALLNALSGAAEIAGGLGVLLPATRRAAGWGLLALLLAVWPANWSMALHGFHQLPAWVLWARLPLQLLLGWWVAWATRLCAPGTPPPAPAG